MNKTLSTLLLYSFGITTYLCCEAAPVPLHGKIKSGSVEFTAKANVGALTIHGTSEVMVGTITLRSLENHLDVKELTASVPIESISTGMGVRDKHMRKHVFLSESGEYPDLKFKSSVSKCRQGTSSTRCKIDGLLTIRGITRELSVQLEIEESNKANQFHSTVQGTVDMSSHDIKPIKQFGVKIDKRVDFTVDLVIDASKK